MQKINLDFFEQILIYKSLTDEKYLSTVISAVNPAHFKDKNIKTIYTIIKDFYNKRNVPPTITELKTYLIDSDSREAFKTVVNKFSEMDKSFNNDELIENTERYIKERSIWHTMLDISKDVSNGKIDTGFILDKFEKSCNVNLKTNIGLDLFKDINILIDDLNTEQPVIPTGYKFLDRKLGGGWLKNGRAIYIFAGETNVGKSIFLGNFATNIANNGKTVLLITLEMSELVYAKRLASSVSKIPISELKVESQTLKTQILEHTKDNPTSKLVIKEFPPSTITPSQLQGYLKNIQSTGVHIDAIVLDYINLLKGPTGDNSYERVKIVTEQVRALSYIFNCPIITATQLNRSGYDTDKPGLESISESIGLAATADFIGIITQSDEDRELNITRMNIAKNRFGPNYGTTTLRIDYKTLTIYEDDSLESGGDLSDNARALQILSS
jgi:replicative DNA helicase